MFYEVIPTKVFRQDGGILTYSSDLALRPGHLVRIPLGRATTNGIILQQVTDINFPTKPIERLLYDSPLPSHLLKSILWLSDYYLAPLPQVASLALPVGLEKSRRGGDLTKFPATLRDSSFNGDSKCFSAVLPDLRLSEGDLTEFPATLRGYDLASTEGPATAGARRRGAPEIPLNRHQQTAIKSLQVTESPTKLLHGITGSGKTNIYLTLTQSTLEQNKSVILLVPEIALTSQLVQIFCSTFHQEVTLIHSRQTESERHRIWQQLLNSNKPEIVIGPRSALFAPLANLGLIIIDEAHESAYHQENAPKYSALRLASFIAQAEHIGCILGSATPLVTDYYLAKSKSALVTLDHKAKSDARTPDIHLVNLSRDYPSPAAEPASFNKNRYFSDQLLTAIANNLAQKQQSLIFHNRRGSAPLTLCEKCGWQALCPSCLLPLTLHSDSYELVCHTCGFATQLPHSCPDCGHPEIVHKGFGTKLLETELKKLFPDARIVRFDADNKKSESLDQLYDEVKNGDYDIIIGTQTVAKGLDLPRLATVGIVQADAGLALPDYSAEERCFELITQVIGRVGRGHLATAEVFIQTYQPDHPAILNAIKGDYPAFADYLLKKRRTSALPPYLYLAKLSLSFKTESVTVRKIRELHRALLAYAKTQPAQKLLIAPPTPAFHEQSSQGFTWQIILKSRSRATLLSAIKSLPPQLSAKLKISLDPPSLL